MGITKKLNAPFFSALAWMSKSFLVLQWTRAFAWWIEVWFAYFVPFIFLWRPEWPFTKVGQGLPYDWLCKYIFIVVSSKQILLFVFLMIICRKRSDSTPGSENVLLKLRTMSTQSHENLIFAINFCTFCDLFCSISSSITKIFYQNFSCKNFSISLNRIEYCLELNGLKFQKFNRKL